MPPSSSSSKPAPLPLAPDRAAISNKISLLLSGRTSLLKTLNPPSSAAQTTATTVQRRHHAISSDDIEQLFSGPRPNEGVGYVPDAKAASKDAASKEDRMLRGRLLGKGKGARNQKGGKFTAESESDEEPGRSGLGKRKRPRREEVGEEEEVDKVEEKEEDVKMDEEKPTDVETGDDKGGEEDAAVADGENSGSGGNDEDERERNKKEKKRKKRQREKQKQKQKQASSSS